MAISEIRCGRSLEAHTSKILASGRLVVGGLARVCQIGELVAGLGCLCLYILANGSYDVLV
jgi:hypothetical protein